MRTRAYLIITGALLGLVAAIQAAVVAFKVGDLVRLTRSETLLFKGETFLGAPKGQEFNVLKQDAAQVYVSFFKADGTQIAVTVPADALESVPPNAWNDLLGAVEGLRTQRYEDARKLLVRAGQDPQYRSAASLLMGRINMMVAGKNSPAVLQGLRESSEQLCKLGYLSLALPMEETADRLAAQGGNAGLPSKIDRADLLRRVTLSNRAVGRTRQAMALHRLVEASALVAEGLAAEPGRVELKTAQAYIEKKIADSEDDYRLADSFRKKQGGVVHALSALQDGIKRCADHPKLLALRKEMSEALEERTSPPVTPAFLKAAGVTVSASKNLEEGHRIYTSRCTECHDLEMLDSRSISGWQKMVASMARRAGMNETQQAHVIEYLAAAQNSVESAK
ncbi:MAG: hypothetical protein JWL90_1925 [Chthoniobacteraceae bacterium]|nr:hypothetical protein [Chthoniobacteraceae bacterium]